MVTCRRLSQSSGAPRPGPLTDQALRVTNEVLELLQDGHYVGWISNTAICTYLDVIDGCNSKVHAAIYRFVLPRRIPCN